MLHVYMYISTLKNIHVLFFSQDEDSVGYQGLPSAQFFASPRGKSEKKIFV